MFYETLQEKFFRIVKGKDLLDNEVIIKTRILKPVEAIGKPDRDDFPLLKGREVLMEATFLNVNGQAYTDAPSEFAGPLSRIIGLQLDDSRRKALFIAALNAVMRYVCPDLTTIHCKDNEPEECAREIVNFLRSLNPGSLGLIGLQPAILASLVNLLGAHNVLCVDRDEKNYDMLKSGVSIGWGDKLGMETLFKQSDLILATGSTVVNGTLTDILTLAEEYHRPVYFYGTTISGTARLMNLNHLCFKSTWDFILSQKIHNSFKKTCIKTEVLRMEKYQMYIDGEWADSITGKTRDVVNPYTLEALWQVPDGNEEDVDKAVNAALEAREAWADTLRIE